MQKKFTLLFFVIVLSVAAHAQTYTQGDVSFTVITNATHDSTRCRSSGSVSYSFVIQNSFIGDSVKVVDGNGYPYWQGSNSTGQNPWTFTQQIVSTFIGDEQAHYTGFTSFTYNPTKVISGPDTISNVNNQFTFPVSDPCEYDTILVTPYMDYNNNCIYDGIDTFIACEITGVTYVTHFPYRKDFYIHFDGSGSFAMPVVQKSWMTYVEVYMRDESAFIYTPSSCTTPVLTYTTLPQFNADFPVQCNGLIDVHCYASASGMVRPGIPFVLHPSVSNIGCDSAIGTLTLVLDARVTYSAGQSTNPATSVSGDTLRWNYANFVNFTNGGYWNSFFAGVHLTPDISVNIGDTLCFNVSATLQTGDVNAANNNYSVCIPVVNSFDPNIKEVEPEGTGAEGFIPGTTNELTYTVHFQNTGNAPAINVSIIDTLNSNIVPGYIQILAASHSMVPEWTKSDVVKFRFSNINLPDSNSYEPASHGFVKFKVKLKPALSAGTQIRNKAGIYFDFNSPIYTNTTLNTLETGTGIAQYDISNPQFEIFPNPANNTVTISIDESMPGSSATITDITGREIMRSAIQIRNPQFDIRNLADGIYFVTVSNGSQSATRKLVVSK